MGIDQLVMPDDQEQTLTRSEVERAREQEQKRPRATPRSEKTK